MSSPPLVLSLFPGLGFLDAAFEEAGYCVVRGPDVIWGGDVRSFHPPAERFQGVIGGPPCQMWSVMANLVRAAGNQPRFGNLIPEYERCVREAAPDWFLMENVRGAPVPNLDGYEVWNHLLRDREVGGLQPRERRISLGLRAGAWSSLMSPFTNLVYGETNPEAAELEAIAGRFSILGDQRSVPVKVGGSGKVKATHTVMRSGVPVSARVGGSGRLKRTVMSDHRTTRDRPKYQAGEVSEGGRKPRKTLTAHTTPRQRDQGLPGRMKIEDMLVLQGFAPDRLDECPFTADGKRHAIGNGVPMAMGRALAAMVQNVTGGEPC